MFAGSGTSTPTLQAILDALHDQDAAIGYSVTYPFGVAAPILCMSLYLAFFKPAIAPPAVERMRALGGARAQSARSSAGRSRSCRRSFPPACGSSRSATSGRTGCRRRRRFSAKATCCSSSEPTPSTIATAHAIIGEAGSGELTADRTALDYVRVFASRRGVVGLPLGSLSIPGGFEHTYVHVRRGDTDLLPDDNLVLEFGDRVGVLCSRDTLSCRAPLLSAIQSRALPTSVTSPSDSASRWACSPG